MIFFKYHVIYIIVVLLQFLFVKTIGATTINKISVINNVNQAIVILDCCTLPIYKVFHLNNPERVVIDFFKVSKIQKKTVPINFDGGNVIKKIRTSISYRSSNIRIVLDLVDVANIMMVQSNRIDKKHFIMLTLINEKKVINKSRKYSLLFNKQCNKTIGHCLSSTNSNNKKLIGSDYVVNNQNYFYSLNDRQSSAVIVVAIDAGHGGQDPGATGCYGVYEKNVTISIAKKLKKLLDLNPMFRAFLIRDGDYFLSVVERANSARKKGAHVLISIHTDSTINVNARGASVWVLSNQRAKSETISLLKCSEKHSELLGGLGDILTNYRNEPYFHRVILDLQFSHSQRVGYDIARYMLAQLKNISILHKSVPEYSGFGILRSPDIPSVLVETGFISNVKESCLLNNSEYQLKIASALYRGLYFYFLEHPKMLFHRMCV